MSDSATTPTFPLTRDGVFFVCMEGCLTTYSRQGAEAYGFECNVCTEGGALRRARENGSTPEQGTTR